MKIDEQLWNCTMKGPNMTISLFFAWVGNQLFMMHRCKINCGKSPVYPSENIHRYNMSHHHLKSSTLGYDNNYTC